MDMTELPPKKRSSDRGKEIMVEPLEENSLQTNFTRPEQPKITIGILRLRDDLTPGVMLEKSESVAPPSPPPRPRTPVVCKTCGQKFSSTQALGGHQNAHRKEKEAQRAMQAAAQEFGTNPFMDSLSGTLRHPMPMRGPYMGQNYHYHPYNRGYAPRTYQQRPVYSHPGASLSGGPLSALERAILAERLAESSSSRPNLQWPPNYVPSMAPEEP